jgi:hypothetical protein
LFFCFFLFFIALWFYIFAYLSLFFPISARASLLSLVAHGGLGRISQVLTTAVILAVVCLLEIAVLRILIGGGVAALNAT